MRRQSHTHTHTHRIESNRNAMQILANSICHPIIICISPNYKYTYMQTHTNLSTFLHRTLQLTDCILHSIRAKQSSPCNFYDSHKIFITTNNRKYINIFEIARNGAPDLLRCIMWAEDAIAHKLAHTTNYLPSHPISCHQIGRLTTAWQLLMYAEKFQCDQIEFSQYVNGCVATFKRSISIKLTWLLWIAGKVAIVTT